jgi:hypothetical protein
MALVFKTIIYVGNYATGDLTLRNDGKIKLLDERTARKSLIVENF